MLIKLLVFTYVHTVGRRSVCMHVHQKPLLIRDATFSNEMSRHNIKHHVLPITWATSYSASIHGSIPRCIRYKLLRTNANINILNTNPPMTLAQ